MKCRGKALSNHRPSPPDRAVETARLPEGRYSGCGKITPVCDNLSIHTKDAFYEASGPDRARAPVRQISFCHMPKHGSWFSIAENELSAMTRQCVSGRRIGNTDPLRKEIGAWAEDVNKSRRGAEWQMKISDVRCKLRSAYTNSMLKSLIIEQQNRRHGGRRYHCYGCFIRYSVLS